MTLSYRGHTPDHSNFWKTFESIPNEDRFDSFLIFFDDLKSAVEKNKYTLREVGFALEPGYYDNAIQADPHGGDMTIVCDLAKELAAWNFESKEEAEEIWLQIKQIMQKYAHSSERTNL